MISGGEDTKINLGPPELLIDVPYSMGCFLLPKDFQVNKPPSTSMTNLSPASCLTTCMSENEEQRFAGMLTKIIIILINNRSN